MPVGLDGSWNLAALQVPGVYVDIIVPNPNLNGTPTNMVGLVGVGSWGKTNSIISISNPTDCSVKLGYPQVRTSDIATYIAAGINVGGAASFQCVRVTDGTDTAATVAVNNPFAGAAATGTIALPTNATNAQTVTVGGTVVTFVTSGATGNQVNIAGSAALSAAALLSFLSASLDANISLCTYTITSPTTTINVTYKTHSTAGNAFTLATNVTGGSVSGATLSGGTNPPTQITLTAACTGTLGNGIRFGIAAGTQSGTYSATVSFPGAVSEIFNNVGGTGNTFWVNLANAINNGNATRGPSARIVALAGAATAAPVLSISWALSGGTDGASGVTDATLVGTDTLPRSGMYVLRSSGCAALGLCDLSTPADWPAMDAFALSESMLNCVATPSGDTIANAVATRLSVGLDSEWTWICVGDYPTFFDGYNGYSRLVSPVAFMCAFVGNWSPEQSPLNKVIRGISATQKTQTGIPYADADLQVANMGGVDLIIGPPSTVGGSYFTFATGRNASSNTAANEVNYTTLTDFLVRTADSKTAGSIIGRLQSIQPNDPTRAQAKALFDGFSAQLANPDSGSGGYGIIDTPWSVVCDLSNNPPALQARGYLFLYWTIRYLNVVRYFVVKLAGGGNVTVTVQSTPPSPAQFQ